MSVKRRKLCHLQAVRSVILSEIDTPRGIPATISHTSAGAIAMTTSRRFPFQCVVRVETDSWFIFGEVRYCSFLHDDGYEVGIVLLTDRFDKAT